MTIENIRNSILELLRINKYIGLTITDLVSKSNYSRSSIRTALAYLEGNKQVTYVNIGMAKLYRKAKK